MSAEKAHPQEVFKENNPLRVWVAGEPEPAEPNHPGNGRLRKDLREYAYYWAEGHFKQHPSVERCVVLVRVGAFRPFRYEARAVRSVTVALSHTNQPWKEGFSPNKKGREREVRRERRRIVGVRNMTNAAPLPSLPLLACSFCGRSPEEALQIQGPAVQICVFCVDMSVMIFREERGLVVDEIVRAWGEADDKAGIKAEQAIFAAELERHAEELAEEEEGLRRDRVATAVCATVSSVPRSPERAFELGVFTEVGRLLGRSRRLRQDCLTWARRSPPTASP